jgi:hypothetical protein
MYDITLSDRAGPRERAPTRLRGRRVAFKEIGDGTDQIDLCAAVPVVGTAVRRLILLDVSVF